MYADLEDAMLSSPPAERARYLGPCWEAADREVRIGVLRRSNCDGVDWLDLAWRAAEQRARQRFVTQWCLELRTAIEVARHKGLLVNGALVKWQELVRRLNDLERDSDLADLALALKELLGAPPSLTRGVSAAQRERWRRG
jgi:hypothetical protein